MARAFEVRVDIPFTPKSPHLVRVFPHGWDEYGLERVRVHDTVADDEIRRALASHAECYSVRTVVQFTPSSLDKTRWVSPSRTTR